MSAPVRRPVVEVAGSHGVPVIVAAGYPWLSEGLQVGELAGRFPGVRFVATNGGQINISGLGQTDVELGAGGQPEPRRCRPQVSTARTSSRTSSGGSAPSASCSRAASRYFEPRLEILRARWMHVGEEARAAVLGGNATDLFDL